MSAYEVIDRSTGLPLLDLACVPGIVSIKFPFLRTETRSVSAKRIYQAFLANQQCSFSREEGGRGSSGSGEDAGAKTRCVTVTYDSVIIGDLESGKLLHNFNLRSTSSPAGSTDSSKQPLSLFLLQPSSSDEEGEEDASRSPGRGSAATTNGASTGWLAMTSGGVDTTQDPSDHQTTLTLHEQEEQEARDFGGVSKKDLPKTIPSTTNPSEYVLLQIPVKEDLERFVSCLQTLFRHHSGGTEEIPIHFVPSLAAFRAIFAKKPSLLFDDSRLSALPTPAIPRQLWAVLGRRSEILLDRMRHVRSEFTILDQETKQDAEVLQKNTDEALKATKREKKFYRKKVEELEKRIELENQRQQVLNGLEAKIQATKEEYAVATNNFEQHAVQFALEEQNWQLLLTTRQQEELKEKQALTSQELANKSHVGDTVKDTRDLERQIEQVKKEKAAYQSEEYRTAVEQRDQAIVDLELATMDLEKEQNPKVQTKRRRVIESIDEELQKQDALRKLRHETVKELEDEIKVHTDLIGDIESFEKEITTYSDAELILQARQNEFQQTVDILRQKLDAVRQQNDILASDLETVAPERPLYVVTKAKLAESMTRRAKLEDTVVKQDKERNQRKTDLQQKLFDVQLRVNALKRHLE